MIEALRGLGYSTATALADIVDNCISANATEIAIHFYWDGSESSISVIDNGKGMNEVELDSAMRLGNKSPTEARAAHDLGRFGMGLKTASFSQCRRLTVASRKDGRTTCLRWDLDAIAMSTDDGWHLLEGPSEGSERYLSTLDTQSHGTVVLWEKIDRIVASGFTEQDYLDLIDHVERHLSMVFHRFIEGETPRLQLSINGKRVWPIDPFLGKHPATWSSPVERISDAGSIVEVQCHVLPHKDKLDATALVAAAGPDGWTAQQGFYIYRNTRLLVAGSWLGLGRGRSWTKEEAHRLARIRVDINNNSDAAWKIDIRKSTARPPASIRERLTRLAEDTRGRARKVFAHRGQQLRSPSGLSIAHAWRAEHYKGGVRYRINIDHPAVRAVIDEAGSREPQLRTMLRIIEETIPVQRIWLDTAETTETPRTGFSGAPAAEVTVVLTALYRSMILRKGFSVEAAKQQLLLTEPFNNYPELVAALPNENPTME